MSPIGSLGCGRRTPEATAFGDPPIAFISKPWSSGVHFARFHATPIEKRLWQDNKALYVPIAVLTFVLGQCLECCNESSTPRRSTWLDASTEEGRRCTCSETNFGKEACFPRTDGLKGTSVSARRSPQALVTCLTELRCGTPEPLQAFQMLSSTLTSLARHTSTLLMGSLVTPLEYYRGAACRIPNKQSGPCPSRFSKQPSGAFRGPLDPDPAVPEFALRIRISNLAPFSTGNQSIDRRLVRLQIT